MPYRGRRGSRAARIALYDNAKLLLIVLVVAGHLLQMGFLHRYRTSRALFSFIYAFHIPLFVFLAGLFIRPGRLTRTEALRRSNRFLAWALVSKLLKVLYRMALGLTPHLDLLNYGDVSWFMFAMAVFVWLAYLLRDAPVTPVLVASVVLALVVGYVPWVGDVLCLSRIVVFFPFFWLGNVLDPKRLSAVLDDRRVRIACAVIVVGFAILCLAKTKRFYRMRRLFKGRFWYGAIKQIKHCGWVDRLHAYAISTVVGAAFLGVVPRRRLGRLTEWGSRTLQVYLLHYPLLYVMWYGLKLIRPLAAAPWGWLVPLPLSVAITALLSLDVVTIPVKAFDRWLMSRNWGKLLRRFTPKGR